MEIYIARVKLRNKDRQRENKEIFILEILSE